MAQNVLNEAKNLSSEYLDLLEGLKDILVGKRTLLGISPEEWDENLYDSHSMLYEWYFAKNHGLIRKVGIRQENDIKDVITVPTKLGKEVYNLILGDVSKTAEIEQYWRRIGTLSKSCIFGLLSNNNINLGV